MAAKKTDPSRRAWPLFLLFVLVGLGALIPFATQALRDIRIAWFYKPATCNVISSSTYSTTTTFHRTEKRVSVHPTFTYQLQVGGRWYTATGYDNMGGSTSSPDVLSDFRSGQSYPCWYDPWNPEHAVLRRQVYKPYYVFLAIPALFLLIGGTFLVKSLRPVPEVRLDTDTGEALAVRLRAEMSGTKAAGCLGAAALVLTAALAAYYLAMRSGAASGEGHFSLFVILLAIDAFIVYHLVKTIRGLGIPEPVVEIDHEPLRPGDKARLYVRQSGPARFDAFKVSLVCEEQGQKGTRKLHSHQLVDRKGVSITEAANQTDSVTIEIPANAHPSMKELQTIVTWKIVIKRQSALKTPDREFDFRVLRSDA